MLEETAQVVRVDSGGVWVETQRRSTCSSCTARTGCGTATLAKVLGRRRTRMRVLSDIDLHVGDQVIIGIRERALVQGSLAVYAMPIALMLLGALLGELGARQFLWQSAELASMILGAAGLAGGLWRLKQFTRKITNDRNYQPSVLRRSNIPLNLNVIE